MPLVSMKLTPKESKEQSEGPAVADRPQFPFGLSIRLSEEQIEKLGIVTLPKVGTKLALLARVDVERVSETSTQGDGKHRSMELQITDMGLEKETNIAAAAEKLYGGKA